MTLPTELNSLILVILATFLLGVSKSGVKGISIFVVTLFAIIFGGKTSTGVLMPMLIVGDVFAIIYYRNHIVWPLLFKLLPSMVVGVFIGVIVGEQMEEVLFKRAMSFFILISVVIMYFWEKMDKGYIITSQWFTILMGLIAGFTTMIGNLAGAFSNIYFLAMRIDKNQFIGTAAYLFFIINIIKFPFHVFYWDTVTKDSIYINFVLLPFLFLGLWTGVKLLKKINTKIFRQLILALTALGALIILIK